MNKPPKKPRRRRYQFKIRTCGKASPNRPYEFTSSCFAANQAEARRHVKQVLRNIIRACSAECIEDPQLVEES